MLCSHLTPVGPTRSGDSVLFTRYFSSNNPIHSKPTPPRFTLHHATSLAPRTLRLPLVLAFCHARTASDPSASHAGPRHVTRMVNLRAPPLYSGRYAAADVSYMHLMVLAWGEVMSEADNSAIAQRRVNNAMDAPVPAKGPQQAKKDF